MKSALYYMIVLILFSTTSTAQTVIWHRFTPYVLRYDQASDVLFEVKVAGNPTAVVLENQGVNLPMHDEGIDGDRLAGDSIFTIRLDASGITSTTDPSDVHRPFVGYCKLYQGSALVLRINLFAEVWTESIPLVDVRVVDSTLQQAPHVVNFKGSVLASDFDAVVSEWTKKFYELYEDEYDFLNYIILPASPANRHHLFVQNDVEGIGLPLYDNASRYGSAGKLVGINVFPIGSMFDGAGRAYQHELGHRWINFLHRTPFEVGIPHWPLSDVASGIMGVNLAGGQGGDFPFSLVADGENYRLQPSTSFPLFSDLELYLMGLLPKDSVGPHFVFEDQDQIPVPGGTLKGPVTWVTIDDVVSALGPRIPGASPRNRPLRIGTVIISDRLLSLEEISLYDFFSSRAALKEEVPYADGFQKGIAKPFYLTTGGRWELDATIGNRRPAQELTIDIKPHACPNIISSRSNGTIPVAVLGTNSFDVTAINLSSIVMEGVRPSSARILDISSPPNRPFPRESNACLSGQPDGLFDLVLQFKTQILLGAIRDKILSDRNTLNLTARLKDGTIVQGSDQIVLRHPGPSMAALEDEDTVVGDSPSISVHPNPFNPSTTIRFELPEPSMVTLIIFDILGREVLRLIDNQPMEDGIYQRDLTVSHIASGVYFYQLEARSNLGSMKRFLDVKKLVIMK